MSGDFIISPDSDKYKQLEKIQALGVTTGISGSAIGIAGKAASIFCKNGSASKGFLSSISSFGVFAGILGLTAMGTTYFLKDSVSEADILKQKLIVFGNEQKKDLNDTIDKLQGESPQISKSSIKYYIELAKLKWLETKKGIQQSIYIMLGWRK